MIECTKEKNLLEFISHERNLTVDIAIKSTHIEDLIRFTNEKDVLKAITGAILMAAEYFNVKDMSDVQATQTASLFIEQFPMETFEDLLICLKNAKIGKYGKIYNRIDGQLIFTWFREYLEEKYERFEQIKRKERDELQKETDEAFLPLLKQAIQESDNRPSKIIHRTTYESHFNQFSKIVKLFNKSEVQKSLEYYQKQEASTHYGQFSQYIELLKNRLNELSKTKQINRRNRNDT